MGVPRGGRGGTGGTGGRGGGIGGEAGSPGGRGEPGQQGVRGQRGKGAFGWSQAFVYLACFAAVGYSYWVNHNSIDEIEAERVERTDQTCLLNERKQHEDIRGLKTTYGYLVSLNQRQRKQPLNALIIRELPRIEKEAKQDDAAPFCDEPNVGLPEPDLKVPERPESL